MSFDIYWNLSKKHAIASIASTSVPSFFERNYQNHILLVINGSVTKRTHDGVPLIMVQKTTKTIQPNHFLKCNIDYERIHGLKDGRVDAGTYAKSGHVPSNVATNKQML